MEKEKKCRNCAYRGEVPGSAHINCEFNWGKSKLKPPKVNSCGVDRGWYRFPFDFDPVWQIEKCSAFSTTLK
ncbi:unnamed protein product [marine sediment metagenome]|uniref:Uncharacterized protein n=1 Tax=marine sediment metagenome TaxID=412755 RepID=X1B8F9_9ZZZZ